MNVFTSDTAMLSDEYGIQIGRWQQYRQQGLPFDAMWCVIPPGGSSAEDFHPERELQVVVSGSGAVETPATGPTDIDTPKELGCAADEREELSYAR
jgi:hypothetical protein